MGPSCVALPVRLRIRYACFVVSLGLMAFIMPMTEATNGVAMEVPFKLL